MIKVLFSGCFDPLHYGHILALKEAKKLGDYLIVNVSSDERVRFRKGEGKPVIPETERVKIVKELRDVDEVVCLKGNEFPNIKLLDLVHPDVAVIEEGHPNNTSLKSACQLRGIQFVELPRIVTESGLSSSKILEKIKYDI